MASNKVLYVVIFVLVLVIVAGGFFVLGGNKAKVEPESGEQIVVNQPAAANNNEPLSEQPDKAKFSEYLTSAALAKLPAGVEFSPFAIIKTKVFSAGEKFCTSLEIKKTIPAGSIATAVYDVNAKDDVRPKSSFPQTVKTGGSVGCEDLQQPVGRYEYKIYLDDVLAAILPFEVK